MSFGYTLFKSRKLATVHDTLRVCKIQNPVYPVLFCMAKVPEEDLEMRWRTPNPGNLGNETNNHQVSQARREVLRKL